MTALPTETWVPDDTFGARLVLLRRTLGLTVEQVAKLSGIPHPTWSTWENGAKPRDMAAKVRQIAEATNCDQNWLMWGGALRSRCFSLVPLDSGQLEFHYGPEPALTAV